VSIIAPTHPARLAGPWRDTGAWRPETVWTAWRRIVAATPEKTAVVDADQRLSFEVLSNRAERIASQLALLGVRTGDRVAFQLPNWWEAIAIYLATARIGAVAVPILPIARERDLDFVLAESRARVFFVPGMVRGTDHRALAAAVRVRHATLTHVVTVRSAPLDDMLSLDDLPCANAGPPPTDAEAIWLLMYTSGTTAAPKGVLHSHATLLAKAHSLGAVHALTPADTVLMPSPLTHISGLLYCLLVPAVHGTGSILMSRWDPPAALELIARERVTYMIGAPTFLRDLADAAPDDPRSLESFRLFSCGGAVVDPTLVRAAAARLDCVAKRVYGSTEFPTMTTSGPDDPEEARVDTEGRPFGSTELRIALPGGTEAPVGHEGEVQARGPECFLGYLDPRLNPDAFTDDGWYRTGDLGVLDHDGRLRITGRLKDVIIRKGENVSAREVEELVATHPAVAEVAVVGLPDAAAGEIVCAVLRVRPGHDAPSLADLGAHLRAAGLSTRKVPERIEVVAEFPRTASGKIVKRDLQRRLGAPIR